VARHALQNAAEILLRRKATLGRNFLYGQSCVLQHVASLHYLEVDPVLVRAQANMLAKNTTEQAVADMQFARQCWQGQGVPARRLQPG
jgi:hypothetical protein